VTIVWYVMKDEGGRVVTIVWYVTTPYNIMW
jgi:hypothetical protein